MAATNDASGGPRNRSPVRLLPFQEQIIADLNRDDVLCILAAGLGWHKILAAFLAAHASAPQGSGDPPGALIVIGATDTQRSLLRDELCRHYPAGEVPIDVTANVLAPERLEHYGAGRVCFVTTRILVVDLLSGRLAPRKVAGMAVLNAHRVRDTSGEGFAVRLLRAANTEGFVRGFSDRPSAFGAGFAKVEKVMKALQVRKVVLWPRFQKVVRDDLEAAPIEVIELCQELTPSMVAVQECIMEIIGMLIKELRRTNKFDSSDLTLENGMFKSFDEIVRRQLDPIWHTVGWKTKQIVQDLQQLRKLTAYLIRYDAVTFLRFLEQLRSTGAQSVWLFHDASHTVFEQAKRRVYAVRKHTQEASKERGRKRKRATPGWVSGTHRSAERDPADLMVAGPVLEELPKWKSLRDVLEEAQRDRRKVEEARSQQGCSIGEGRLNQSTSPILVVCKELYMCQQLPQAVADSKAMMAALYNDYLLSKMDERGRKDPRWWRGKKDNPRANEMRAALAEHGPGTTKVENEALLEAAARAVADDRGDALPGGNRDAEKGAMGGPQRAHGPRRGRGQGPGRGRASRARQLTEEPAPASHLLLPEGEPIESCDVMWSLEGGSLLEGVRFHSLDSHDEFVLHDAQPLFVVMYDLDVAFMRQLEVYKAERPDQPLRLYLMTYNSSIEQHKYRSEIQREIDIFTDLIENKGKINIPLDIGHTAAGPALHPGVDELYMGVGAGSSTARNAVTRRAGGRRGDRGGPRRVVVDIREFMSSLPAVLHQRGFEIAPVTLEVGDYVLSPELVVERKSLPDLFGSFRSGRLYHQAEVMCRHYKTPILLIEFEEDKQFVLQAPGDVGNDISSYNIISKLVLLTLHFPKLRLVWSRSLHATATIFAALKSNQDEPDGTQAAAVGMPIGADGRPTNDAEALVNQAAVDVLRKLPGVTETNYRAIMSKCNCLADLKDLTQDALEAILGSNKNARILKGFLDATCPQH